MSRVDEAMRRAAEAAKRASQEATDGLMKPAVGIDPSDVADDAFPAELADSIEPRPVGRTSPGFEAVDVALRAADVPVSAAEAEKPPPPSFFERLAPKLAAKIVIDEKMHSATREQYRRLAAALHHANAASGLKVAMIASAMIGEGKTLTSSNLALTLSESYQRSVLLIDADLRRPSLHTLFNIVGSPGLTEGLAFPEERKLHLHQVTERLTILPAGRPTSDPMAGLTSPRMRELLDEARTAFDWVILDTPPIGLLTDANLLAAMVDGALLVVKANSTPFDLVRRAIEAIGPDRMLGVVLNGARERARGYGYGYGYYDRYNPRVAAVDTPQ